MECKNLKEADFGILFDVDGVIARGTQALEPAKRMIKELCDEQNNLKVPIAFVTNACNRTADKARQISNWLDLEIKPEYMMHAQSPLSVFHKYHDKHVLVVGQGHIHDIAKELGFKNTCSIDDVKEAYPLLDMVDHANRRKVAQGYIEKEFPKIDAVVVFGEPNRWESNLQLLIDLILTNGLPTHASDKIPSPEEQLPILAANMDLVFMAEACMPRFGNGSFLVCLEALYKKITGHELQYKALVGKPCELTFRYAEHVIQQHAKALGITRPIEKLYFIGDNPLVDIFGANMYNQYIHHIRKTSNSNYVNGDVLDNVNSNMNTSKTTNGYIAPMSRQIPPEADFDEQTVLDCEGILVGTGVYKPTKNNFNGEAKSMHQVHRDIEKRPDFCIPRHFADDVHKAILYILKKQHFVV
ncbi:unnamed protein product [Owenia fusiformis]|uniref:Uncharacterized protein n=1 Tax=Owenia fusiformis TaxID=6347 RepID=A0A8J1T6X1_OWEFU|nr:unnamed protein product [Owenia fusiformis]